MSTWVPSGQPPSERDPRKVSESLDRIARRLGGPSATAATAVFSRWADLVGADIAAHATPVSLRDGVLTLSVDHPAWATQLRYMTADLLHRLADTTGRDVREIRLRVTGETAGQEPRRGTGRTGSAGPDRGGRRKGS